MTWPGMCERRSVDKIRPLGSYSGGSKRFYGMDGMDSIMANKPPVKKPLIRPFFSGGGVR